MDTDALMKELVVFLKSKSVDMRCAAVNHILGLLSDESGFSLVSKHEECCLKLVSLACEDDVPNVRKSAFQCLINLSSDEELSEKLAKFKDGKLIKYCLQTIKDKDSTAESASMLLSNLTRSPNAAQLVWGLVANTESILSLKTIVELTSTYNGDWGHLTQVLCNLSQLTPVRRELLNRETSLMKRLLAAINVSNCPLKTKGFVGAVRNCCFETEAHEWLLSEDIDILSTIALPLAGPEELTIDENEMLPISLQYLEKAKTREPDPDVRKMLIETLLQLCATKFGRKMLKDQGIYYIMRELHKWETVKAVLIACENLVDILIGDEPSEEMENLKLVDIPLDLQRKFKEMDEEDNAL